MARSTYFDRGRIADACPGSESGYAQRFQCGNVVRRLIWTRMRLVTVFSHLDLETAQIAAEELKSSYFWNKQ
jgi:hypothetical protein